METKPTIHVSHKLDGTTMERGRIVKTHKKENHQNLDHYKKVIQC